MNIGECKKPKLKNCRKLELKKQRASKENRSLNPVLYLYNACIPVKTINENYHIIRLSLLQSPEVLKLAKKRVKGLRYFYINQVEFQLLDILK